MNPGGGGPYGADIARVHHEGFGFHADACAPGIVELLEPVRARGGLVLEIGCGSGHLTRHLTEAGHRVVATDASPAMLDIAREYAPDAIEHRVLALPVDELPAADAIVSTGHALSYLPTAGQLEESLRACARALAPGGILALDLEDLSVLDTQLGRPPTTWRGNGWILIVDRVSDGPTHFARCHTILVREDDGRYRRVEDRHDNVLVDVRAVATPLLEAEGLEVEVGETFGPEELMAGLLVVVAHRPG